MHQREDDHAGSFTGAIDPEILVNSIEGKTETREKIPPVSGGLYDHEDFPLGEAQLAMSPH